MIAFDPPQAIFLSDRSWTVLLDVRDHREKIGLDVEAATGDTSKIDLIWVPGEGSSTGNVTGGRKFARHHFVDWAKSGSRRLIRLHSKRDAFLRGYPLADLPRALCWSSPLPPFTDQPAIYGRRPAGM